MLKKIKNKEYIRGFIQSFLFAKRYDVTIFEITISKNNGGVIVNIFVDNPNTLIGEGGCHSGYLARGLSKTMDVSLKLNVEKWKE